MRHHRIARFCARHGYDRRAILTVIVMATGHPDTPFARLLVDFHRGRGPAAIAAGRPCPTQAHACPVVVVTGSEEVAA